MSPYVFVLAAVLAVVPMLFFFKLNVEKLKENPELAGKVQTNFFIMAAASEAIPLVLIVFGIANIETVGSMDELYVPGLAVILIMVISFIFVMLQRSVGVPEENKQVVNSFSAVSIALVNAIPIVALVCLFMMMPA